MSVKLSLNNEGCLSSLFFTTLILIIEKGVMGRVSIFQIIIL